MALTKKRCSLCKEELLDVRKVGAIAVSACRRCDRAQCQHCKKPIGELLTAEPRPTRCEHCGQADPLSPAFRGVNDND